MLVNRRTEGSVGGVSVIVGPRGGWLDKDEVTSIEISDRVSDVYHP